jgi:membrane-bound lytic murein transglycosylase D
MRIMRIKAVLIFSLFTFTCINAIPLRDTIIVESDNSVDRITRDLDSLVNSWYVKLVLKEMPVNSLNDSVIAEFPDSVYKERISKIPSIIKLPYNSIIRNHIHVYTEKKPDDFSAILGLKDYYFPMIEDIFDSYGIPAELKNMAVIESALNPNAVSRAGATGMWQFMYSTGRLYGLTINSVVDERRDPVKATHAAARFLRDLYNIYNDWPLVIAAYNCGPGNVDKAIRRSGNKKDYWEIYYRLPRETRGYIPQYVAAFYLMNCYKDHNLKPLPLNIPVATDSIMVNKDIHLAQISEVMNIPLGELKMLNPQYRTGLVPGGSKPQALTLPISHLGDFIDLSDTIRKYKSDIYLNKSYLSVNPSRSTFLPPDIKGKTKVYYTVKDGDNLGFISEWYRVGLSDLRYWNDIYGNTIRVGQRLSVFVDPAKADYYSAINSLTFEEKQKLTGQAVTVNQPVETNETGSDSEYVLYRVQNGDTIWDIVKKFDNVSTSGLLSLNNISDPGKIKVGQILKIKRKS